MESPAQMQQQIAGNGGMPERRVLVFPAGTEIGLEIFAALKGCRNTSLFAAGEDIPNHARLLYREYHVLPHVTHAAFSSEIAGLCRRLEIDYVFPAHDDALTALSKMQASLGAKVIAPSADTCEITRSKRATYQRLEAFIQTPRVFHDPRSIDTFPVFIKPDRGQGSLNAFRADDEEQLAHALRTAHDPLVCEYLPGEEYTVDCFSSLRQGLLFCHARRRDRIRNGISNCTVTVELPGIDHMARAIATQLEMRGAWFFQVKRSSAGALTLLEVAPRIAGAMAAHRVQGINFPLLSLMEQDGLNLQIQQNQGSVELDRSLRNRYRHDIEFDALYIDLDDTLILNGEVHLEALKLIFQCINAKKPVTLLTRHALDIEKTLQQHRLHGLFDRVVHITDGSMKSAHIQRDGHPIFVDDSFSERQEVRKTLGIPTFDLSMIELLTEQGFAPRPHRPSLKESHHG
ncbi:ATP-grasp domain-containing protein [Paracidovorax oryzae]|uniref:ATP-grasp domain-containing protein n=1 Tax=Paracidovorax oryzae TaxID=862720 RepID=UPI0004979F67|nr:ATP-grasp domain-containing protein [Paracidovorax oryzae]